MEEETKTTNQNHDISSAENTSSETSQSLKDPLGSLTDEDIIVPRQKPTRQSPKASPEDQEKSIVRTYQSDIADTVRTKKVSVTQMALAEQKRAERLQQGEVATALDIHPHHYLRNILITLGGIFVLILAGAGYITYMRLTSDTSVGPTQEVHLEKEALLIVTGQEKLTLASPRRTPLVTQLTHTRENTALGVGALHDVFFVQTVVDEITEDEFEAVISAETFVRALQTRASESFIRSLSEEFMIGLYGGDPTELFLMFKTEQFDAAFAGMLDWEEQMADDLSFLTKAVEPPAPVVVTPPVSVATTSTSTATSTMTSTTTPTTTPAIIPIEEPEAPTTFVDQIVKNRDTRVLYDAYGNVRSMYSFPNSDTLIITGSLQAMEHIFERLTVAQFSE